MNRQIKRSLEPPAIPQRTHKQQILCDAIEQNYPNLERTIQVYVSRIIKQFGDKFDLSSDRNSIQTIATEILNKTVETVLDKSEEFDLNYSPLPWIKKFAVNKAKGWQRDQTRSSEKVVSISKFSLSQNNVSEAEILGILSKSSQSSNTEDSTMMGYLLSLVNESDRQILQ
ncbi:MAG: sigma-70 family RNA polymerase sigma factor, partial [Waterburya sp.]